MTTGFIRREVLGGLLSTPALSGLISSATEAIDTTAAIATPVLLTDFRRDSYLVNGRRRGDASSTPGLAARHAGGLALTPEGALRAFPAGMPRQDDKAGLLLEAASGNLSAGYNAAPMTTLGWSASPGVGSATWTVVDRRDELYAATAPASGALIFRDLIDAGIMNGNVLQGYNPDPRKPFVVLADGAIATAGAHSISAWVRCVSGTGDIRISGAANGPKFGHTDWRRTIRANITAAVGKGLSVVVDPMSTVEIILWQIEPGPMCTSPIVVAGTPAVRAADRLSLVNSSLFKAPFTVVMDAFMDRADAVDRTWFSVSGSGAAVTVTRARDNALILSGSGEGHDGTLQPRVPRILGPGGARTALQVRAQGRSVSVASANAHDAFSLAPEGLDTLMIANGPDGSTPLNAWVRSVEISGIGTAAALAVATSPPVDAMAHDIRRYVDPAGDDSADGLTPATAWATLARVAASTLPAGIQVLLKRGASWSETVSPPSHWCTIGTYGEGSRPVVGAGQDYGFDENGRNGVRVEGLHFRDWKIRGWNNSGFDSHMLQDCEIGPILSGQPETDRLGVASRHFRNFYIGGCHVHDVTGDDVFLQDTPDGWIISEGNRYDPPAGSAADNFQVSQNVAAHVRLTGDTYDMRGSDSGKGNVVLAGGASAVIEDFRAYGLNFSMGVDSDNAVVRRGHISGARQNSYSWGVGAGGPGDIRNHVYEDLVIEDCNRGISCSGTGGGPNDGPDRVDFVVRRVTVRNNGIGLFVDRPTSGDLSDITYEGNDADKVVNTRSIPVGGTYDTLIT